MYNFTSLFITDTVIHYCYKITPAIRGVKYFIDSSVHRSAYKTIDNVPFVSLARTVIQDGIKARNELTAQLERCKMDWLFSSLDALFEFPRWYVGAILGTGFLTYYLREAVKVCV